MTNTHRASSRLLTLWILGIVALVPSARPIVDHLERGQLLWVLIMPVGAMVLAIAAFAFRAGAGARERLILLAAAVLFGGAAYSLRRRPEEAAHLLQYGGLALIAWHWFHPQMPDRERFFSVTGLCLTIGVGDELLQWLHPRRTFDYRDIGINFVAALIMASCLGALSYVRSSPGNREPKVHSSPAYVLWATALLLLAACASLTPERARELRAALPVMAEFLPSDEVPTEYGYLHRVKGRISFPSRLSGSGLAQCDHEVALAPPAELFNCPDPAQYPAALASLSPFTHPFEHELCVRLFRREELKREAARGENSDAQAYAALENIILQDKFRESTRAIRQEWRAGSLTADETLLPYRIPVSANLIVAVSQKLLVSSLLAFAALLLAARLCWKNGPVRYSLMPKQGKS